MNLNKSSRCFLLLLKVENERILFNYYAKKKKENSCSK